MSFWDRHGNVVAGVIVLLLTALFVGGYVGAMLFGPPFGVVVECEDDEGHRNPRCP
jgi:hypothetical protein